MSVTHRCFLGVGHVINPNLWGFPPVPAVGGLLREVLPLFFFFSWGVGVAFPSSSSSFSSAFSSSLSSLLSLASSMPLWGRVLRIWDSQNPLSSPSEPGGGSQPLSPAPPFGPSSSSLGALALPVSSSPELLQDRGGGGCQEGLGGFGGPWEGFWGPWEDSSIPGVLWGGHFWWPVWLRASQGVPTPPVSPRNPHARPLRGHRTPQNPPKFPPGEPQALTVVPKILPGTLKSPQELPKFLLNLPPTPPGTPARPQSHLEPSDM